jgi:hypothetical protein
MNTNTKALHRVVRVYWPSTYGAASTDAWARCADALRAAGLMLPDDDTDGLAEAEWLRQTAQAFEDAAWREYATHH